MVSLQVSLLLSVLLAPVFLHLTYGQTPYCEKVENSGKALPYVPDQYQTIVEMNDIIRNTTYEFEEWYRFADNNKGQGKLRVHQTGQLSEFYFSYITQEIFYVNPKNLQCMIFNMSNAGELNDFFGQNVGSIIQMGSVREILRISTDYGMKYMGVETIRGIQADRWYSCQNWTDRNAQFTVDWYWSSETWATATEPQMPLRAVVKGIVTIPNKPVQEVNRVYDFAFFRKMLTQDPDELFQTPNGVYCWGRKQTQPIPTLTPIMIYEQEMLIGDEAFSVVKYGKLFYDATQKLVRYDYREPNGAITGPFYNFGTMSVIQDFNSGVAYYIDQALGNCTDQPIGIDFFYDKSVDLKDSPGWHIAELRSPNDLFKIDNTYQFEGRKMARGLPVDVYISSRTDFEIPKAGPLNVTYEYYMLDPNVAEETIGKGKVGLGISVPIELRIIQVSEFGPDVDPGFVYQERYNFYNFDVGDSDKLTDAPRPYSFDIGSCFKKEEKMNVQLKFIGDLSLVKKQPSEFIRAAVVAAGQSDLGFANPIRFQSPLLDFDDRFIYLTFTLLDAPHLYSRFIRTKNSDDYVLTSDGSTTALSEKDCLQMCADQKILNTCNAVAFCPGVRNNNCVASSQLGIKKNPTSGQSCNVFVRPINASLIATSELDLETAWMLIKSNVLIKMLNVTLEDAQGRKVSYSAIEASNYDILPDVLNPNTGRHMGMFTETKSRAVRDPELKVEDRISADECAVSCINELSFDCKAFTYCYDLAQCFITSKTPDSSNLLGRARCNVYTKTDLAKFNLFRGKSAAGGKNGEIVKSEELCAQRCLNSTSCRSFDFCNLNIGGATKVCYMSSGHTTDQSQLKNTTGCNHYSRSYAIDFVQKARVTNADFSGYYEYSQLTEDACARKCVEEFGQGCRGYYYCAQSENSNGFNKCVIVKADDPTVSSRAGQPVPVCNYKERVFNMDGSPYSNSKGAPPSSSSVSGGVVAVVMVLVVIVGTVIGMLLLIGIFSLKGKSVIQDMKAAITRR